MFTSLGTATKGLNAAQVGLSTTGHNLSNMNVYGYTRQQNIQVDSFYINKGYTNLGTKQIGTGTEISTIRQIRDQFLDKQYRDEASRAGFYNVKYEVGLEIETIIGELQSDYDTKSVVEDVWKALNELSTNPDSIAARGVFVSTCTTFLDKFSTVYDDLKAEQYNLNNQIIEVVEEINTLVGQIKEFNEKISIIERSGDSANDYRDSRNLALDELSKLIPITYTENPRGFIEVMCEGNYLVTEGSINKIGLRYTSGDYSFVEPVFSNSNEILPSTNTINRDLIKMVGDVNVELGNDNSVLRGLLIARGTTPITHLSEPVRPDATDTAKYPLGTKDLNYQADYRQYEIDKFNIEKAVIPKTMKDLDTIFNAVCTIINDALAPQVKNEDTAPYDLEGNQSYLEIFVRNQEPYSNRYDGSDTYIEEDPDNYYSQYTLGNVVINPVLMNVDGYDKIALSPSGEPNDNTLILNLMEAWTNDYLVMPGETKASSISDSYSLFVSKHGNETNEALTYYEQQITNMTNLENNRTSVSGVSLDEEMTNMMMYQHSYNAAARLVNIIDSMIDTIVNRM